MTRSRMVGMPSGRSPSPLGFGIITRRTGSGRYVLRDQFLAQARKPLLQTRCFDRREGYSVHSWRSRIGAGQRIGMAQNVFTVNLVVEQVEAERRLRLRLTIQLSLKGLDRYRCCQAHRQSPSPHHLPKHTRSQGPLLCWHYPASTLLRPCPTPVRTAACRDVEVTPLAHHGSPSITRTTFPTCRAHYPGGSSGCVRRLLPRSRGLPQMAGGSASALSLSRCYGASGRAEILGAGPESKEQCHGKSK